MSRLLTVSTNAPANLECIFEQCPDALRFSEETAGGFGVGYYKEGELLIRREPREQGMVLDLRDELGAIE